MVGPNITLYSCLECIKVDMLGMIVGCIVGSFGDMEGSRFLRGRREDCIMRRCCRKDSRGSWDHNLWRKRLRIMMFTRLIMLMITRMVIRWITMMMPKSMIMSSLYTMIKSRLLCMTSLSCMIKFKWSRRFSWSCMIRSSWSCMIRFSWSCRIRFSCQREARWDRMAGRGRKEKARLSMPTGGA